MIIIHLGKLYPPNECIEVFSFNLLEVLNKKGINADLMCFDKFTEECNKNLDFVLKAFSKLNYLNLYIKLVISGISNKNDQLRYFKFLDLLHIKNSVVFTDYINEEQKNSLIENSKAFLFYLLSKAEGFERPIVENLLYGATAIASDIEVFREIGDKYIYYVNINDENCLVDLFKNFSYQKFSYEEVLDYLKSKFDVTVLSEKLIQKIYSAIGYQNG
jgi:glycosyltransferase involved in cell wall biosynthesis